jgi:hypothetical protein
LVFFIWPKKAGTGVALKKGPGRPGMWLRNVKGGILMKKWMLGLFTVLWTFIPGLAMAAGPKASDLVVVADTRVIESTVIKYFSSLYNFSPILFATWAVVLTAAYGGFLGLLMDMIMSRTGLDLTSRKIVEH